MAQIDHITVRRSVTDGHYGSRALEVGAVLVAGDDPAAETVRLQEFVRARLRADARAEAEAGARAWSEEEG